MTNSGNKKSITREIFSDSSGGLSSFRIMAMIGMVAGSATLVLQSLGYSDADLNAALMALFGGIFAGKAWQKHAEETNK